MSVKHSSSCGQRNSKFERGLKRLMHTELHWLDVPERVKYKLCMLMPYSSISEGTLCADLGNGITTAYSFGHQSPADSFVTSSNHTYGRRAIAVDNCPMTRNSLPKTFASTILQKRGALSLVVFLKLSVGPYSAHWRLSTTRNINSHLHYTLYLKKGAHWLWH